MALQWVTPSGNIGNVTDGEYFEFQLVCTNAVSYKVIAGTIGDGLYLIGNTNVPPSGNITVKQAGTIVGIPTSANIGGVNNTFTVRAYDASNNLSDRSFNLTINKNSLPVITPKNTSLGIYFITDFVNVQLQSAFDQTDITWDIISGQLPPGLTINSSGIITGIIQNINYVKPIISGWSGFVYSSGVANYGFVGWDTTGWDAQQNTPAEFTFQFMVRASNGFAYDDSIYTMVILNQTSITADSTVIDSDSSSVDADSTNTAQPTITNIQTILPNIRENSDFLYQVTGFASNNYDVGFEFYGNNNPTWMNIDSGSGWIYGTSPYINSSLAEVQFTVDCYLLANPTIKSIPVTFKFVIMQDLSNYVIWESPQFLGNISNGDVSLFEIKAKAGVSQNQVITIFELDAGLTTFDVSTTSFDSSIKYTSGIPLKYILNYATPVSGDFLDPRTNVILYNTPTKSKLPQGLKLLTNGLIVGKTSFRQFTMDSGNTTLDSGNTTIESVFTFSVTATDATTFTLDGSLTTFDNTLTLFDTLYPSTVPYAPVTEQLFIDYNKTTFDSGKTKFYYDEPRTVLKQQEIYATQQFSIKVNHDNNNPYMDFYLTALLDVPTRTKFLNIMNDQRYFPYEYIYRMYDPNFGKTSEMKSLFCTGLSPASASTIASNIQLNTSNRILNYGKIKTAIANDPVTTNTLYEVVYLELVDPINPNNLQRPQMYINPKSGLPIYPCDLNNMQKRLSGIGVANQNILPLWMTTRQNDGTILGFVRSVVLCYTKPGYSNLIAYRLSESNYNFGDIPFIVDRYMADNQLLTNYDLNSGSFIPSTETTFDIHPHINNTYVYKGSIDVGVDIPFDQISGRSVSYINSNGGLDGEMVQDGMLIAFITQSNYLPPTSPNVSVAFYSTPNDGWNDADALGNYTIEIPGYADVLNGTAKTNVRPNIWQVTIDSNGIVHLVSFIQISAGDYIFVNKGNMHENTGFYFTGQPDATSTVPRFLPFNFVTNFSANKTTFDGSGTRFFNNVDEFVTSDEYNFWVKFPQTTLI